MSGLTEAARKVRRTKNLVSMKFNLLNFLMETLSVLLLLAIKSYFIRILYLLVRYIYLSISDLYRRNDFWGSTANLRQALI